ncbi:sensor histidine kinase [Geitlerinema sp. PCC 9228]|uniref:sensor histidine kinase n=1 Tax=Geitlerinema sp. PCC 9228 TaxID=111611 RepID=UPI001FCD2FB2|nr:sensor histidine kinase [Geitlerinema sp. PCC 9228]
METTVQKLFRQSHPFRLLLYLEWILLGIALLMVFFSLPLPHPPHHRFSIDRAPYRLAATTAIAALGLMGWRFPVASRFAQVLYTVVGFGLSWLAVMLGGRGHILFTALLLVVVIRACLMFRWGGRLVVAAMAYGSFLSMSLLSLLGIRPFGIPLGRPLPPAIRRLPADLLQNFLFGLTFNMALLFALVLGFVLLLVSSVVAESRSRKELASANRRLRQYALTIENQATLQERNRIAREIHDSVGHALAAQSIQLENVAMLLPDNASHIRDRLQKARDLGREALQSVRQSVATLRQNPLKQKDLPAAIAYLTEEFTANHNIQIDTDMRVRSQLSAEAIAPIYRILQEALTNIAKHSDADRVRLHVIDNPTEISLLVEDNGCGFDPSANTTGFGLQSMRERAEALGGRLTLHSQPGRGCQIRVTVPQEGESSD